MTKTHERVEGGSDMVIRVNGREFALSEEECRLILLTVAGDTNQDMARKFSLNASTVSRRTARLLRKLSLANKLELVFFALHYGIISMISNGRH